MPIVVEKMSVGPSAVSTKVYGFSYIFLTAAIIFSGIPTRTVYEAQFFC